MARSACKLARHTIALIGVLITLQRPKVQTLIEKDGEHYPIPKKATPKWLVWLVAPMVKKAMTFVGTSFQRQRSLNT